MNTSRIFAVHRKHNKMSLSQENQEQTVKIQYPGNTTIQILYPTKQASSFREASEFLILLEEAVQRIKQSLSYLTESDKQFFYHKIFFYFQNAKNKSREIANKTSLQLEFLEGHLMPKGENVGQIGEKFQIFFSRLTNDFEELDNKFTNLKINCEIMREKIQSPQYGTSLRKLVDPILAGVVCFSFISIGAGIISGQPALLVVGAIAGLGAAVFHIPTDPFEPLKNEIKNIEEKGEDLVKNCDVLKIMPKEGLERDHAMLLFYIKKAKDGCANLLRATSL